MRRTAGSLVFLLFLAAALSSTAVAAERDCSRCKPFEIDVAVQRADAERIKGPICLRLKNVNVLRYEVAVGSDATISEGPSLSDFAFIPTLGAPPTPPPPPPAPPDSEREEPSFTPEVKAAMDRLQEKQRDEIALVEQDVGVYEQSYKSLSGLIKSFEAMARNALGLLGNRQFEVLDLVKRSDNVLASQGSDILAAEVATQLRDLKGDLDAAEWPDGEKVRGVKSDLEVLATKLDDIHLRLPGFSAWVNLPGNLVRYQTLRKEVSALAKRLAAVDSAGEQAKEFGQLYADLFQWKTKLTGITAASFSRDVCVPCGYPFPQNKTVEIKLVKVDRTPADADEAESTEVLASIDCPSAVTVTGGIGLSGLEEREFTLVSTKDGEGLQIGFKDHGSQQVNPVVLVNTRFTDSTEHNFYVSAGTVLDVDNPDSSVSIGYILGLSYSLRDNIYLTAGVQAGRISKLAGSFEVGDPAPEGLAAPPIERRWEEGWVAAATFKIR